MGGATSALRTWATPTEDKHAGTGDERSHTSDKSRAGTGVTGAVRLHDRSGRGRFGGPVAVGLAASTTVPVFTEIEVKARIEPAKEEVVPSVAELPTCQ